MPWFGIISYGIAGIVYAAAAAIMLASHPGGRRASLLAAAIVTSMFWAVTIAFLLVGDPPPLAALFALDAIHSGVWIACILSWLSSPTSQRWLIVVPLAAGLWAPLAASGVAGVPGTEWTAFAALLIMSLAGFLVVEQVYRNANDNQRKQNGLLCLAAAGIFVIDLFVYSQATLLQDLVPAIWEARGLANAALVPLVLLAVKRQSEWETELFVSRQVVFYTASLLGVGIYLVVMGVVAYVIRALGGQWTILLEIVFLVAACIVLVAVLFSASIRARFRVFLVKHFFRNKYDYRQEWLQLTQILGRTGDFKMLAENALEGLARIIGSNGAELWLAKEPQRHEWVASYGREQRVQEPYDVAHPIVKFLASSAWVIDSQEYEREPDRYGTAFGDPQDGMLPKDSIIVPLDCQGYLQGFAVLAKPPELRALNFEDHDILRTAGRQAAVLLAQALAQDRLSVTRQFEAMNKLSTFLMHDLKNIVAQQELVVANAQRFRHRPEFIDDAITTIRSSVERMKRLLEQLRAPTQADASSKRADVSKILMEVRSHCADRQPIPKIELNGRAAWVGMDREQLTSVLTHLVRNSQDATPPDGQICISLESRGRDLAITVADTGSGMDAQFVRDRLFRPFDSTKGATGMGIGAYQVRHLVRLAGGDVAVTSMPGKGTTFELRLPTAEGRDFS